MSKWKLPSEAEYSEIVDSYDNEPSLSQSKTIQLKTERYTQAEADLTKCLDMLEGVSERIKRYIETGQPMTEKLQLWTAEKIDEHLKQFKPQQ